MLSRNSVAALKDWMRFCSATGVLPFTWEEVKGKGKVGVSKISSSKKWGGDLTKFIVGVYVIYLICQHYVTLHPVNPTSVSTTFLPFCWVVIYSSGYIWALGSVTSFWKHGASITRNLNEILIINDRLQNVDMQNSIDFVKLTLQFMKLVLAGAYLALNGVHFTRPGSTQYLSSQFSAGSKSYTLFFIVDHISVNFAATFCFVDLTLLLYYVVATTRTIEILRIASFRRIDKVLMYKQLELLNRCHLDCDNARVHQLMYCFGITTVLGNVGLIQFHEVFTLFDFAAMVFFGHVMCVLCLAVLHSFGTLPFECESFLRYMRSNVRRKLLRKRVRCLQIFGIEWTPIKVTRFNAIFHWMGASINMIVTCLVFLR